MRSASRARDLARCPHCVSCRRCRLQPCVRVSPLLPCVSSAAMGVAAAIRIVCGHAGRRRCGCRLWPCVLSPSRVSSVAVGVAAAGCGCRRRHHLYRLRPWVLSPPPCKSLRPCALLLRAARIAAAAVMRRLVRSLGCPLNDDSQLRSRSFASKTRETYREKQRSSDISVRQVDLLTKSSLRLPLDRTVVYIQ